MCWLFPSVLECPWYNHVLDLTCSLLYFFSCDLGGSPKPQAAGQSEKPPHAIDLHMVLTSNQSHPAKKGLHTGFLGQSLNRNNYLILTLLISNAGFHSNYVTKIKCSLG